MRTFLSSEREGAVGVIFDVGYGRAAAAFGAAVHGRHHVGEGIVGVGRDFGAGGV